MSLHGEVHEPACLCMAAGMGASIVKLIVPDAKGRKADVVLGYDEVEQCVVGNNIYGPSCTLGCPGG